MTFFSNLTNRWSHSDLRQLLIALREYGLEATTWLLFTLVGGLVPVWGGYLLFKLYQRAEFVDFYSNGEFALYSAGLLASSLYLVVKNHKTSLFTYRPLFALLCAMGLAVSLILFAGVMAVKTLSGTSNAIRPDIAFLRQVSLLLFCISTIISFLITVIDNYRSTPIDVREERARDAKKLEEEFDELEGNDAD